jgi:hypothetical protein
MMGKVILGLTMSLDGFNNDQNGSVDSLYPNLDELRDSEPLKETIRTSGAVVMGRHSFAMGDPETNGIWIHCTAKSYALLSQMGLWRGKHMTIFFIKTAQSISVPSMGS